MNVKSKLLEDYFRKFERILKEELNFIKQSQTLLK